MLARHYLCAALAVLIGSCSVQCWGPARADEPVRVDAGQLCAVKRALGRGRAWSPGDCTTVAAALNATPDPPLMRAVCTNESDLDERAHRVTVLSDGRIAHDVGLCGVRCVLYPSSIDTSGRCTNGPARGLTVKQLKDPTTNIRTASAIMATKRRPGHYNAGSPAKALAYEQRIAALVSAYDGEMRIPRGVRGKLWARIKDHCRRIVGVTQKDKRS